MGKLIDGEELDVDFLQFKQLKNEFNSYIPPESLPRCFGDNRTNFLAIDQATGTIFWAVLDGVEYCRLRELAKKTGEVRGTRVKIEEGIQSVLVNDGWLIVTSDKSIFMYEINKLSENIDAVKINAKEARFTSIAGNYVTWLEEVGSVGHVKLGDLSPKLLESTNFQALCGTAGEDACWVIDENTRSLKKLSLPDGKELAKIEQPDNVGTKEDSLSLISLDKNLLAVGIGDSVYIVNGEDGEDSKWIKFEDPARTISGDHYFRFTALNGWSKNLTQFVVIADSGSPDLVSAGMTEKGFKSFFILSEEGLPQLPLSKGVETFPVSMALDFTNSDSVAPTNPEDEMLPPQPVLWILNSDGTFCPFRIVKTNQSEMHPLMSPLPPVFESPKEPLDTKENEDKAKVKIEAKTKDDSVDILPPLKTVPLVEDKEPLISMPEPLYAPVLSKLTEDLGLLNNAIVGEFVELYEGFNADLEQIYGVGSEIYDRIMKNRPLINDLEVYSLDLARFSGILDSQFPSVASQERQVMELFNRIAAIKKTTQVEASLELIPNIVQKLFESIGKTEGLLKDAQKIEDVGDRQDFVRENILPELETSLDFLTNSALVPNTFEPPQKFTQSKSAKWSRLHDSLRQRSVNEIDLTREAPKMEQVAPKVEQLTAKMKNLSFCGPIPAPLDLPKVDVKPITRSTAFTDVPGTVRINQPGPASKPIFKPTPDLVPVPKPTLKSPNEALKFSFAPPQASTITPALNLGSHPEKMASKPDAGEPIFGPMSTFLTKVAAPIEKQTPTLAGIEKTELESPTLVTEIKNIDTNAPMLATEAKNVNASTSTLTAEVKNIDINAPTSTEPFTKAVETSVPSTTEPFTRPVDISPPTPTKLSANIEDIDVKSPTPKGPKSPDETKQPLWGFSFGSPSTSTTKEKISDTSLSPLNTLGTLDTLDTLNVGSTPAPVETKAGPSIFNVPSVVTEAIKETTTVPSTVSGFRQSTLGNAAPSSSIFGESSEYASPFSTPSKPSGGFGSLSSLGVSQPTTAPIFGAPTGFGTTPTFGAPTGFGTTTFGAPTGLGTTPTFGATTGLGSTTFGVPTGLGTTPTFGNASAFGINTPASSTGASTGATSGFAAFAKPAAGGNLFGAASNATADDPNKKKDLPPSFTQFR